MKQIKAYETEDGEIFATYEEAESYEKRTRGLKSYRIDLYASVKVWAEDEKDAIEIAKGQVYDGDVRFDLINTKVELRATRG